jgi:hypothetical protein
MQYSAVLLWRGCCIQFQAADDDHHGQWNEIAAVRLAVLCRPSRQRKLAPSVHVTIA